MSPLRLAVVGVGHLGRIHARLAAALQSVELVAVVDERREAREALAAETGARGLADYRDLLGEVDAAVVATPTQSHHRVAGDLLRGGVHVLVEKPIALTVHEADELVQLARRRQMVLQVGHVERFNPAYTSVEGQLADPKYIEARRQSGFTFRSMDVGVVLDLMIHDIDLALSLVKSPVNKVEALGVAVMGEHEDMATARLEFASGAVANLTASRTSYSPQRMMQVFTPSRFASLDFAARRSLVVEPRADVIRRELRVAGLDQTECVRLKDQLFEELLVKREVSAPEVNAIEQELRDFAGAIGESRAPRVTGADGRDALAVAEMILERVRGHQWDGADGRRVGPLAPAILPLPMSPVADEIWGDDDTVILRRKAG